MTIPARRTWWKRKRVWAAAGLWLAASYPLSLGPSAYCAGRGWVSGSDSTLTAVYRPLGYLVNRFGGRDAFGWFSRTCYTRVREHAEAASD